MIIIVTTKVAGAPAAVAAAEALVKKATATTSAEVLAEAVLGDPLLPAEAPNVHVILPFHSVLMII